jgi:phosphopantetheine adenylyltransferase
MSEENSVPTSTGDSALEKVWRPVVDSLVGLTSDMIKAATEPQNAQIKELERRVAELEERLQAKRGGGAV